MPTAPATFTPFFNFSFVQGETVSYVFTWEDANLAPINVTGYTADMDIRDSAANLIINLSTSNGRIALGGSAGTVTWTIAAADSQALTPGNYKYDLWMISGAGVKKVLFPGQCTIIPQVTVNP